MNKEKAFEQIERAVEQLDSQEEISRAFDICKARNDYIRRIAVAKFSIGDKVKFEHRGKTHEGEVAKVNQKTVNVMVGFTKWRIAPSYLTKG